MRNATVTVREKQAHAIQQTPHPLYAVTTRERGQCLISLLKKQMFIFQHSMQRQKICICSFTWLRMRSKCFRYTVRLSSLITQLNFGLRQFLRKQINGLERKREHSRNKINVIYKICIRASYSNFLTPPYNGLCTKFVTLYSVSHSLPNHAFIFGRPPVCSSNKVPLVSSSFDKAQMLDLLGGCRPPNFSRNCCWHDIKEMQGSVASGTHYTKIS
jgi:hypothetical protein